MMVPIEVATKVVTNALWNYGWFLKNAVVEEVAAELKKSSIVPEEANVRSAIEMALTSRKTRTKAENAARIIEALQTLGFVQKETPTNADHIHLEPSTGMTPRLSPRPRC